ncbi:hypothetical protein chiPu_0028852, partial [Chiloscyllium punctatum]|nr:hypothetical protein [Chiloscyllium punctatum]
MLGNRTLSRHLFTSCVKVDTNGSEVLVSDLWKLFCDSETVENSSCDSYFVHNNLTEILGIPGMASGAIV